MANHLRELLEFYEKGMNFRDCHRDEIRSAERNVFNSLLAAENAISFDIGDVNRLNGISYKQGSIENIPYKDCWFELKTEDAIWGCVLTESEQQEYENKVYNWFWYARYKGIWRYQFAMETFGIDHQQVLLFDSGDDNVRMQHLRSAVLIFLSAIQCKNVIKKENKPDEKLQKARAKRGKKPLFSYWTLELSDQKTKSGATCGGTHASPRLHLRRGHPRQFKPGEWTWVQPCVVGNKSLGMVHKDYKFVPGEMAA